MGGRKVCFIDDNGQVGTCIRDDENCIKCDIATIQTHQEWVDSENRMSSKSISDYYMDIYAELVAIEKLMCEIRGISVVTYNLGYLNIYDDLNTKTSKVDDIVRNLEQLLLEQMRKQRKDAERDVQRLKTVLNRVG